VIVGVLVLGGPYCRGVRFSKYDFGSVFGSVLGKTAVFGSVFGFLKNRGYRFGFRFLVFLPSDV